MAALQLFWDVFLTLGDFSLAFLPGSTPRGDTPFMTNVTTGSGSKRWRERSILPAQERPHNCSENIILIIYIDRHTCLYYGKYQNRRSFRSVSASVSVWIKLFFFQLTMILYLRADRTWLPRPSSPMWRLFVIFLEFTSEGILYDSMNMESPVCDTFEYRCWSRFKVTSWLNLQFSPEDYVYIDSRCYVDIFFVYFTIT